MFLFGAKHFYIYSCLSCVFPFINLTQNIGYSLGLSMKILLSLIICSQVAGTCLEPYQWPTRFNTQYDCLMFGYEESLKKMKEIGRADVNQYNMFVKFYCTPEKPTI